MKIKIQVVIEHDDESIETIVEEVGCLQRDIPSLETLGLSLAESKDILARIQSHLLNQQIEQHIRIHQVCPHCHQSIRRNGHQTIVYRTLFGTFNLRGQRFYHCACHPQPTKTVSPIAQLIPERTAPEFTYLQVKWSSLMSYGLTVELLEEVLPLSANVASAYRHTHEVAQRMEEELGEEQYMYIDGPPRDWAALPPPDERLFVGIDGGYVRERDETRRKAGHFEVIVGKSLQANHPSKRFAFVQTYDEKPKRRLSETLKAHGMQMNQDITFLSDGGDDVRELQYYLNPNAEHILDWFHVTMRITTMRQIARGMKNAQFVEETLAALDRIKWRLWHGHVDNALWSIQNLIIDCDIVEGWDAKRSKLQKALEEYETYIDNNRHTIPNYADRHRYGEPISTSFAESAINKVVSKRMVKKQQMRWTKEGAHLLLQVRVKTLNDELRDTFERWYPGMATNSLATNHVSINQQC